MREIIMLMGFPASGKSTLTKQYVRSGYVPLNRDTMGGTISGLHAKLRNLLSDARMERVILDNTYGTAESRSGALKVAASFGVPVKCIWMKTSIEDAQFNAAWRIKSLTGDILAPKSCNPQIFPPVVLFAYRKRFEKPDMSEGFASIEEVEFDREMPAGYDNAATIFDYDGTLRETISGEKYPRTADDVRLLPGRKETVDKLIASGAIVLGASNQSGIHKGSLSLADAEHAFARTNRLLGHQLDVRFCPHKSNPLSCWCRKPMPGMGVGFVVDYKLDPKKVTMVGDMTSDKTFARRCGFNFIHANDYFC